MNTKKFTILTALLLVLTVASAASTDAPQLTVAAAHYAFNTHGSNWQCDGQSELSGLSCTSPYAPSYTFMHNFWVTQDPTTGAYFGITLGGARDGGFQPRVGDVSTTWALAGAQAGAHKLRRTTIDDDSVIGCTHLLNGGPCHWVVDSTLWGDPATNLDALYAFYGVYDTGAFASSQRHWFMLGESFDGANTFDWTPVFKVVRPGGQGTGAAHLFTRFSFIQDPADSFRWIGLMSWTFNNGGNNSSGTSPVYIDAATQRFGALFQHAGWCEFPLGKEWNNFSDTNSCGSGTTLGDNFYSIPGFGSSGKNLSDLSLINGKALVLQTSGTAQRCDQYTNLGYASEAACAKAHAPCPPGQDNNLYVQRRDDPAFSGGRFWTVRELDFSTWNTGSTGHQWNGAKVTILDGPQHQQFKINPTDSKETGSYHGGSLRQFQDGRIYLYLPIKHTLCLPETTNALNSWNRFPIGSSGNSMMWLRLTQ